LDKKGEDIREAEIPENCVFIFGDQEGFPEKELRRLKKSLTTVSIGPKMYFASQTVTIVNNELDRRGI
jgi:tRNA pseudouridine-54 N-methylase